MKPVDARDALHRYFAFPDFRPGQEAALGHVLAGRDTLVVMPTGSGKSLIYQLAGLMRPDTALVVSPLVALMKDQVDGLTRRGIPATFINSSLDSAEQSRRVHALAEGRLKIVLVAPERFRSRAFCEALARVRLGLLAVDEAHCLSQWGHDFRPDYLRLAEARRQFNPPVTLALTATATPRVQDDIVRLLGLPRAERIVTGFNRPTLTFEALYAPDTNAKLGLVRDFLTGMEGAGIVYTGTRRDAEEVAGFVRDVVGRPARHYHAALDAAARAEVQDAFLSGDLPLIVATNAFGMGIDRPDVRFVLHYAMPGTLEAYYQEAGRAGRDGLPARAVLMHSPRDVSLQEFFIENDSPSAADLRGVHAFLRGQSPPGGGAPVVAVTLDEIERATGLPQVKARVAVEQLEIAQSLRRESEGAFGALRLAVLPLSESALRTVAAQVAERREHKRRQLQRMVAYAETDDCRRRLLLDHFGDSSPADAPLCCDNCLARADSESTPGETRPAESQAERAALIVLDTVARLGRGIGRGKLAQVLKGSAGADIAPHAQNRNFGKFAVLRLSEIESLIDQLIGSGHLKPAGGDRPTLRLTPRGETALRARAAIRVDLRRVQPAAAQRLRAEREAGGTVALTGQMLARGLSPEGIAAERGLTVDTVYSHLARLIADGRVSANAVVPAALQASIRAAIEKAGSAGYLAPIKALLPEEIDYGVIRCVVEAWKLEQAPGARAGAAPPQGVSPAGDATAAASPELSDLPLEPLRRWRRERALHLDQPEFHLFGDDTLRRLARRRPRTKAELRAMAGLSAGVIDRFGDEILSVLRATTTSETVQAILDCVRSLPGRLPRSGVAKVLVGSESERVGELRSHPLYNCLPGRNRVDVTAQVDVLIEMGLVAQDGKGRLVPGSAGASSPQPVVSPPVSTELFGRLRAWRSERARADGVPPYVVFSDEALRGIVSARPRTREELLSIRGIGPAKVEKYGAEVLALVARSSG